MINSSNSAVFISHGGGPLPLLDDHAHKQLVENLRHLASVVGKPSAIIIISAHWEEDKPTVTTSANPPLIYDYYGFPEESYEIEYPAAGQPTLANQLIDLLNDNGFQAQADEARGFDHGLFVPLKIMYPEADIPCVQLSLLNNLSGKEHIQLGKALSGLTDENLLIVGSGLSFHNLKAFFSPATAESQSMNKQFEEWLIATCSDDNFNEDERTQRLVNWENAPGARYCHPREEHLLPLHVCYGYANRPAKQVFEFEVMGKMASAYLW